MQNNVRGVSDGVSKMRRATIFSPAGLKQMGNLWLAVAVVGLGAGNAERSFAVNISIRHQERKRDLWIITIPHVAQRRADT